MLDYDEGVAQIPQLFEGGEQLVVVALVQADGGLVENVEHAHEARADLRGQTDALALAAGQGCRGAAQGQIAQAHRLQKSQPRADLLENLVGDHGILAGELQTIYEVQLVRDGHAAELHDVESAHGDAQHQLAQTVAVTAGAGHRGHTLLQLFAHGVGLGLVEPAFDVGQHTFKRLLQCAAAVAAVIVELEFFCTRAIEHGVQSLLAQILDGRVEPEAIALAQGLKVHPGDGVSLDAGPAGGLDAALQNGEAGVGDDDLRVGLELKAQARALRTRTVGIVEREHPRRELRHGDAAVVTGVVLGIDLL